MYISLLFKAGKKCGPLSPRMPSVVGEDSWVLSVPGQCWKRGRWVIMGPWNSFREEELKTMRPDIRGRGKM